MHDLLIFVSDNMNGVHKMGIEIGRAIKVERTRVGLTQVELAERLGWHQTKVSRIEGGDTDPQYLELVALSAVFGRALSEWLPEAPDTAKPEPAEARL